MIVLLDESSVMYRLSIISRSLISSCTSLSMAAGLLSSIVPAVSETIVPHSSSRSINTRFAASDSAAENRAFSGSYVYFPHFLILFITKNGFFTPYLFRIISYADVFPSRLYTSTNAGKISSLMIVFPILSTPLTCHQLAGSSNGISSPICRRRCSSASSPRPFLTRTSQ